MTKQIPPYKVRQRIASIASGLTYHEEPAVTASQCGATADDIEETLDELEDAIEEARDAIRR